MTVKLGCVYFPLEKLKAKRSNLCIVIATCLHYVQSESSPFAFVSIDSFSLAVWSSRVSLFRLFRGFAHSEL